LYNGIYTETSLGHLAAQHPAFSKRFSRGDVSLVPFPRPHFPRAHTRTRARARPGSGLGIATPRPPACPVAERRALLYILRCFYRLIAWLCFAVGLVLAYLCALVLRLTTGRVRLALEGCCIAKILHGCWCWSWGGRGWRRCRCWGITAFLHAMFLYNTTSWGVTFDTLLVHAFE
jgi:hypothetical protein